MLAASISSLLSLVLFFFFKLQFPPGQPGSYPRLLPNRGLLISPLQISPPLGGIIKADLCFSPHMVLCLEVSLLGRSLNPWLLMRGMNIWDTQS